MPLTEEQIENDKRLQGTYPSMLNEPCRRDGEDGKPQYVETPALLASRMLKEKGIRLVDLSREDIAEIRVDAMVGAAQAAGRSEEDIESMGTYLRAGIENGCSDEESMRRSLHISLSRDLEQQTNDLNLRKEVQAENDRIDHGQYPNSDFRKYDEQIEQDRLSNTVAHQ